MTSESLPCKYIGGDPRVDAQGAGDVVVESAGISVHLHGQKLQWPTDSLIAVTYEQEQLGMERAEYEEDVPIGPGEWLIRHTALLVVADPEGVFPDGFRVRMSFRNEYSARLFVKWCNKGLRRRVGKS
jgi:hypothetical protein